MTLVKRFYVEPSDILAIELECGNCGATVSFSLKNWRPEPRACPSCEGALIDERTTNVKGVDALRALVESLNTLTNTKFSFRLRLAFEEPK